MRSYLLCSLVIGRVGDVVYFNWLEPQRWVGLAMLALLALSVSEQAIVIATGVALDVMAIPKLSKRSAAGLDSVFAPRRPVTVLRSS